MQMLEGKASSPKLSLYSQGGSGSSLPNTKHLREGQAHSWVRFGMGMLKTGTSLIISKPERWDGAGGFVPEHHAHPPPQHPSKMWLFLGVASGAKHAGFG